MGVRQGEVGTLRRRLDRTRGLNAGMNTYGQLVFERVEMCVLARDLRHRGVLGVDIALLGVRHSESMGCGERRDDNEERNERDHPTWQDSMRETVPCSSRGIQELIRVTRVKVCTSTLQSKEAKGKHDMSRIYITNVAGLHLIFIVPTAPCYDFRTSTGR